MIPYVAISLVFSCIAVSFSRRDCIFEYYFKIATNLTHMNRYAESIPFFQRALHTMPSSGQAKFYYGSTLVQIGKCAEGAALLEEAKKNFQDIYLFKNLGLAYARIGQPERAMEQYRRWREMGIASNEANNNIALILMRQGRGREAADLFKQTLRVRPWDWVAYSSLAAILLDSGRAEEAVQVLNPGPLWKIPDAFMLYGAALLETGRVAEAEQQFQRALSGDPKSVKVRNNLGVLYNRIGKKDEAIEQWEEVLRLDPNNSFAKEKLTAARKGKK